ncbi:hypothetical protein AB4Y38_35320 [Paraburkholderia sp. EG285A]|uniref:hypothetical protein n=1 Tax=Paraburkholderia sp. EG285A TaxID=3237009 RepID=UPI0034D15547
MPVHQFPDAIRDRHCFGVGVVRFHHVVAGQLARNIGELYRELACGASFAKSKNISFSVIRAFLVNKMTCCAMLGRKINFI